VHKQLAAVREIGRKQLEAVIKKTARYCREKRWSYYASDAKQV
jgi:hypothetical protein